MNWKRRQEEVIRQLSPDVARFVLHAFERLEMENVFDAPGVISGIIRQMRIAESDVIRSAAASTERLLKNAFSGGGLRGVGA